jgi:hypothetical protein
MCSSFVLFSYYILPYHQGRNGQKNTLIRIIANSELVRFHSIVKRYEYVAVVLSQTKGLKFLMLMAKKLQVPQMLHKVSDIDASSYVSMFCITLYLVCNRKGNKTGVC